MQSIVKRLQTRKRIGSTVEVRFLPDSLYRHYIATDLQPKVRPDKRKEPADLTAAERRDAEENYHELTFTFQVLSGEERRKWDREALATVKGGGLPSDAFLAYISLKLKEKFESGKHEPKDGSAPVVVDSKFFSEILSELGLFELLDLKNAYYRAQLDAMEQAAGNANTAAQAGGTQ